MYGILKDICLEKYDCVLSYKGFPFQCIGLHPRTFPRTCRVVRFCSTNGPMVIRNLFSLSMNVLHISPL